MAALALKVDKGDNPGGYFRAEQYFPIWVIDLRGLEYVRKYMPAATEDLKNMSRTDAMMKFAFEASRSPFALNCHLYGLRRHKMDTVDNAVLGINAKYLLELCRAVHQTLLVLSHQNGKIAPLPQLFHEKSVDRVSTSSNATTMPGEHERDCDSLLHDSLSSSGDRDIRQERAASQSSKNSDASEQTERKLPSSSAESEPSEIHDHLNHQVADATNARPASVDSASQTIETGTRSAPVDVNFNLKGGITPSDLVILEAYGIPYQSELQYSSSGGSRSDSIQHSNEMLPESMIHSYHHEQGCTHSEDAESTLRSCLPQQSSVSLHDLRTAGIKPPPGYVDERAENEASMITQPALRWCAPDQQMQRLSASGQARSEPKIDSDVSSYALL
ncbi:hypothetical protein OESDEN_05144 [Oesophagostomum dentatum]|uniref:FERM central domain-containing protein n=1 Tax=Oesophagostomum dentatum TaxID=61180 RepID=A0A0B1TBG9_OESDE|nr:hypothetical protein OESDEN_05144 [Oesophagostomum dentatum]